MTPSARESWCEFSEDHPDKTFWCLAHNRDPQECVRDLERELAYRRSYDTGDFTPIAKVIGELQAECDKLKRDVLKARIENLLEMSRLDVDGRIKAEAERDALKARCDAAEERIRQLVKA